jgi:hypothetical protein
LVEFAYNNGYHESLKMSPFEALYGRKCNTPVRWDNPADKAIVGPELLKEMEDQMIRIKQNLKAAQDRQKGYANKNRTHREFKVGDHVFLKVETNRGSLKLGSCAKLAARYCGPLKSWEGLGQLHTCLHYLHLSLYIICFMFNCLRNIYLMLIMLSIGM